MFYPSKLQKSITFILGVHATEFLPANMKSIPQRTIIDLGSVPTTTISLTADSGKRSLVVPLFLDNAFKFLEQHGYRKQEGIFRKEGVSSRLSEAESCLIHGNIPDNVTVFDVCVLIKRFFKYIDGGIFGDKEAEVLNWCFDARGEGVSNPTGLWTYLNTLPPAYFGALGFLLYNLHRITKDSENSKMDDTNLALMFAPVLFVRSLYCNGNITVSAPELRTKERLEEERKRLVHCIVLMIKNYHKILIPPLMFKPSRNGSSRPSSRGPTPDRRASCRSMSVNPDVKLPRYSHVAAPGVERPIAMDGRLQTKPRRFHSFHRIANVFKPFMEERGRIQNKK